MVDMLAGGFGIFIILLLIILTVLWIAIPFLIVGVSNRLDKLNSNLVKIGRILKEEEDDFDSSEYKKIVGTESTERTTSEKVAWIVIILIAVFMITEAIF